MPVTIDPRIGEVHRGEPPAGMDQLGAPTASPQRGSDWPLVEHSTLPPC